MDTKDNSYQQARKLGIVEQVENEGYQAQAAGKDMVKDNPYSSTMQEHWSWRAGFIDAFNDSN